MHIASEHRNVRKQILVKPSEDAIWENAAKTQGVSVGELVRTAVDQYLNPITEDDPTIDDMIQQISHKREETHQLVHSIADKVERLLDSRV